MTSEKAGFDASDCYHSAEADFVVGASAWLLLIVPAALVAMTLLGAVVASPAPVRRFGQDREPPSAVADGMVAAGCSLFLAFAAAAAVHGYSIGRWLDAGCVQQPVPGPMAALGIVVLVAVGALALGRSLERNSLQRRQRRSDYEATSVATETETLV